jgi:predicted nucleic acid-binding protein
MSIEGENVNAHQKEKRAVYIETSIVSYLTARPSSDLLAAAWQKATLDWWDTQQHRFCLYTSDVVWEEASKGDSKAAALRLNALAGIPLLEITDTVLAFSKLLIKAGAIPQKAIDDSLHIALSVVHGIDYLLTWNCRHIDNAETKPIIRNTCIEHGYSCSEICTPIELMGVYQNG